MTQPTISSMTPSSGKRGIAVFEVLVVFLVTFTLIWLTALLPLSKNGRNFLAYIIMIAFPLLVLLATRRDLKSYGLFFGRLREQFDITLSPFPFAALQGAIVGWLLPLYIPNAIIRWEGDLILSI